MDITKKFDISMPHYGKSDCSPELTRNFIGFKISAPEIIVPGETKRNRNLWRLATINLNSSQLSTLKCASGSAMFINMGRNKKGVVARLYAFGTR